MTDLAAQVLTHWSDYLTSGTIAANLTLTIVVLLASLWLASLVPGSTGPLYVCSCGWTTRRRERETERDYHRRQSQHFRTAH